MGQRVGSQKHLLVSKGNVIGITAYEIEGVSSEVIESAFHFRALDCYCQGEIRSKFDHVFYFMHAKTKHTFLLCLMHMEFHKMRKKLL